jgi:hypothetical protein
MPALRRFFKTAGDALDGPIVQTIRVLRITCGLPWRMRDDDGPGPLTRVSAS